MDIFDQMPFNEKIGIEIVSAEDGRAVGELELTPEHSSKPDALVAHGGVTYALADTAAGAAVVSTNLSVTPTIDMRIDYFAPATGGTLQAVAEVIRDGNTVASVDVDVTDDEGRQIATARGTFKTGGGDGRSPWQDSESTV